MKTFLDSGVLFTVIAANVPATLVQASDSLTGIATFNWTVSLANNEEARSTTIGIEVGGFYIRNSSTDDAIVTVTRPLEPRRVAPLRRDRSPRSDPSTSGDVGVAA